METNIDITDIDSIVSANGSEFTTYKMTDDSADIQS